MSVRIRKAGNVMCYFFFFFFFCPGQRHHSVTFLTSYKLNLLDNQAFQGIRRQRKSLFYPILKCSPRIILKGSKPITIYPYSSFQNKAMIRPTRRELVPLPGFPSTESRSGRMRLCKLSPQDGRTLASCLLLCGTLLLSGTKGPSDLNTGMLR